MARKRHAKKSVPEDDSSAPAAQIVHGRFTDHPLLPTLLAVDVLPWQSATHSEIPQIDSEQFQILHELGQWLYRVLSGDANFVSRELQLLAELRQHVERKEAVEQERMKALSRHSTLSGESGIHPNLKSLKAAVRPGSDGSDNKTLRRNLEALGLPTFDEKSTDRIRKTAEKLSAGGRKSINPSELRSALSTRKGKSVPQLPKSNAELLALCVCIGTTLEKKQLFQAFYDVLDQRDAGLVTDWAMATVLPKKVKREHELERRGAIRRYGESIGLCIDQAHECDRDDLRERAPVRKVVNS
jgi:hypothetical protein